jgi:hypothetical protein
MSANIVRFSGDYKIQAGFGTNQQANIYLGTKNNGTVYVDGNLLVSGTTTQITTTNTTIKDNIITLNAGESGSSISQTVAGIEIDRGNLGIRNAQFFFDESKRWARPGGTQPYGLFVFKTADGGINGIQTNSIDTNGGNLNLINDSTGVISVTGTSNYEEHVVNYDVNHHIVMPIVAKDDDIIPNIKTVIDYVSNISAVGNVNVTQNGGTLNIGLNKTVTISNSVTFTSTDTSSTPTVALGTGGTVVYTRNKLSVFSATTSSELAGVISDETGTGLLVFNDSPTIAGHPTVEGITSTGATGTGKFVFDNAPTITGHPTVEGVTSTGATGTGKFVFNDSPTLVTPTLGVAIATSINKIALTSVATGATLTIADDKIVTINNTLTFNGTDTSTISFGAGGTVTYTSNSLSAFSSTTSAELAGVISDETGTGLLVFATSPTLVTPILGAATATTINGLTISTSTGTLTIANGKVLTANNTLTFTGTDSSSVAFGTGGTVTYTSNKLSVFSATTSSELAGVISDETGTGLLVFNDSPTIAGHPTVEGVTSTGATGTGKFVFDNSPTLISPVLGVATATTINGLTISTSTGTLTIANGKTLTASNTLTFTGTDASLVEFGEGGTVTYTRNKLSVFSSTTSAELAGVISDETGTGLLVFATSPTLTTSLITDSTSFNLINTIATTVNFASAATTINIGASTGTITLGNSTLTGTNLTTVNINGTNPTISTSSTGTVGLFNINATTINAFGDATSISIGSNTGTITLGNQIVTGTNLSTFNMNGTTPISIATSTSSSTANIFNTNATTGNLFGAATTINIGASSGTLTIGNAIITATNATTFNMNGSNPSIVTSNTGTANVFNTNALTGNLFGDATTVTIGAINGTITLRNQTLTGSYLSTFNMNGASPLTIATSTQDSTASLFIQNVITGNLFGSAETINIGSTVGTVYINNPTVVGTQTTQNLYNTTATTMNFAGAATTTNISNSGNINLGSSTSATTTVKVGGAISDNTFKIASTDIGTINITSDITTGTINLFTDTTTGTINVGSADDGIVDIAFTTDSISTNTGAVVVAGGVGVGKNLYVGETTTMMFQATDPVADTGGVTVYTKNSDLTNTGIYYVNSTTSGELVSKKKALAYSIVFG